MTNVSFVVQSRTRWPFFIFGTRRYQSYECIYNFAKGGVFQTSPECIRYTNVVGLFKLLDYRDTSQIINNPEGRAVAHYRK